MTDADRMLAALRTGPKFGNELYGLGLMAHSRSADLRRRGHLVSVTRVPGRKGAAAYLYTLIFDAERSPVEASGTHQTSELQTSAVVADGDPEVSTGEQLTLAAA